MRNWRLARVGFGVAMIAGLMGAGPEGADAPRFNYAEAMQRSLYFYEAQQSGRLSPNNRVPWRGAACLEDGKDIGRDLSGGWFDAGDHWTANLTMAWTALCLATAADFYPAAWEGAGQMDELVEELVHVNDYFARCVLNPDAEAADLEVVIGCGGLGGVEGNSVHAEWAPAEVVHRITDRPTFRLTRGVPGGDVPGAMAAAMAASSVVIRDRADALRGRRGFERFDAPAFADRLLRLSEKLIGFAALHAGKEENQGQALRADGRVVKTDYRTEYVVDKLHAAATWLHVAHARRGHAEEAARWLEKDAEFYQTYRDAALDDWWRDSGLTFFGKVGTLNLARIAPGLEPAHRELALYACRFLDYSATPGGLRLREPAAHEWGSLRHANNAAMIALYYADLADSSPPLVGNTWWLKGRDRDRLTAAWRDEGRRQVDYALGANPYGRSYLIGFGQRPFNHPHHRGAYGAWAGFEHLIPGKPEYRPERARHTLHGALVGGPDNQDVFTCKRAGDDYIFKHPENRSWGVVKPRAGYVFDRRDEPFQLVADAQHNEVAIDYNAAFTANLACLQAHGLGRGGPIPDAEFPPPDPRDDTSTDLIATDREFFASGRLTGDAARDVELTVWNRSRWPARIADGLSARVYLAPAQARVARPVVAGNPAARLDLAHLADPVAPYVEIAFPGVAIFPGVRDRREDDFERATLSLGLPAADLKAAPSLAPLGAEERMLPLIPVLDHGRPVGGSLPGAGGPT